MATLGMALVPGAAAQASVVQIDAGGYHTCAVTDQGRGDLLG